MASDNAYSAPVDALQLLICRVWSDILHEPRVGIHSTFLELGGDSIGAMMIANQLQRIFAEELSIEVILGAYTVAQLAEKLRIHYPEAVQRLEVELDEEIALLERGSH
ncbi:MAG: hypothetical protein HC802_13860 [Caldilineaceae bacterium]|nr:hypothetical protein [Caldilineaceae bacterium]